MLSWVSVLECQRFFLQYVQHPVMTKKRKKKKIISDEGLFLLSPFSSHDLRLLSFIQVFELLCHKAQPHRCSAGLMGSMSPRWRRLGLSGDRTGGDGQKWGASCHDNWWGLLIGQETREQDFFFPLSPPPQWKYLPMNEYAHTPAQIINPQSILVVSRRDSKLSHFWFFASHKLYYLCLISLFTGPEKISHCSSMATITYSHACHPPANPIRLEPSKATLHLRGIKKKLSEGTKA